MDNIITQVELTNERLKQHLPAIKRPIFNNIAIDNVRGALLYGPRGVGKTTFLLHKINDKNFLYFLPIIR